MTETPRERIERIKKEDRKREKERLKIAKRGGSVISLKFDEKNILAVASLKLSGSKLKNLTDRQVEVLKSGRKLFSSKNKYFEHYHDFVKAPDVQTKEKVLVDLKRFDHMHCFSHITKKCITEVENAKNLS